MKKLTLTILHLITITLIGCSAPTNHGSIVEENDLCICIEQYDPVCANGKTYSNSCYAMCAKVKNFKPGACLE